MAVLYLYIHQYTLIMSRRFSGYIGYKVTEAICIYFPVIVPYSLNFQVDKF